MFNLPVTFTKLMVKVWVYRGGNEMSPPPFGTGTVTDVPDEPLISSSRGVDACEVGFSTIELTER